MSDWQIVADEIREQREERALIEEERRNSNLWLVLDEDDLCNLEAD